MTAQTRPHNVSPWRIVAEPAQGEIVRRFDYLGVPLCEYVDGGRRETRILLPAEPIQQDYVEIVRREGDSYACNRLERIRERWHEPCSVMPERWRSRPVSVASSRLGLWGISAPPDGEGYHKCDVLIRWVDGAEVSFRFDLQQGGTDGGQDLCDLLPWRLVFHAGLRKPLRFTDAQFSAIVDRNPSYAAHCRDLLTRYEL